VLANDGLDGLADPRLIWRLRGELPIQEICRDRLIVITHRRALKPLAHAGFEAVFLHQPNHALAR
jgi:hypothetical protein